MGLICLVQKNWVFGFNSSPDLPGRLLRWLHAACAAGTAVAYACLSDAAVTALTTDACWIGSGAALRVAEMPSPHIEHEWQLRRFGLLLLLSVLLLLNFKKKKTTKVFFCVCLYVCVCVCVFCFLIHKIINMIEFISPAFRKINKLKT
jgi:hypothetical protein